MDEPRSPSASPAPPATAAVGRRFAWTLFGNLFYTGCQWVIVVVIAKLGTPAMVGQYTLGLAISAPVMLLSGMALRVVQANDAKGERPFGVYLGLRLVSSVAALVVIALIVLLGGHSHETVAVVLLLSLFKAAEAISEIFWAQLQQQREMSAIARSMIIKGFVSMAALAATLAFSRKLPLAILALAGASALTLLFYDVPAGVRHFAQSLRPSFELAPLLRLAWLALPLGVVLMLVSLASNVPRYVLVHYRTEHELGVFSAITNLMIAGASVMTALGQVVSPELARSHVARDGRTFRRLLRLLLLAATVLGIGGIGVSVLLGRPLLTFLYTAEYAGFVAMLLPTMLAGMATYYSNGLGVAISSAGEYRKQVPLQLVNLIATLVATFMLVPGMGALGAAWALVGANVLTALGFAYLAGKVAQPIQGRDA